MKRGNSATNGETNMKNEQNGRLSSGTKVYIVKGQCKSVTWEEVEIEVSAESEAMAIRLAEEMNCDGRLNWREIEADSEPSTFTATPFEGF